MGMNERELAQVVDALQALLGAPFDRAWQPARDRVVVGLGSGIRLLMVPRGPFARLTRARGRPRNPKRPFSFQGALRAHLSGPLTEVDKHPHDRAVTLRFGSGHALHLRLTGRSGGLWLVRGEEVIAAYDGPAPQSLPALPERPPRDDPPRFAPEGDQDWAQAADKYFALAERRHRRDDRRRQLTKRVRVAIQRARRLLRNLERDLDRASEAPALRARADLLASVLHEVPAGASSVTVTDWQTGEPVQLSLDPSRSAVATMEAWYHKARRLDRVGDRVLERMEDAEGQLVELAAALEQLPEADDDTMDAIAELLPAQRRGRRPTGSTDIAEWTDDTGQRVLVGRNARGNRRLTFQLSKGHDVWLHLRDKPGPHVVIPTDRGHTPDLSLLLAAAQIVLVASKVSAGASADVQYAKVKDVRPIPGELARVRIAREKVLHVTRDPAELVGWSQHVGQ